MHRLTRLSHDLLKVKCPHTFEIHFSINCFFQLTTFFMCLFNCFMNSLLSFIYNLTQKFQISSGMQMKILSYFLLNNIAKFKCFSLSLSSLQARIHFQLYQVPIEFSGSIWICSSMVEQMPANGMVVSSSLARSVGFPTVLVAGQKAT